MHRSLRHLWLRGFLPSILALLAAAFSTGTWIVWQGRGTVPFRAVYGGGFIMIAWHDPSRQPMATWIGPRTWYLSIMLDGKTMQPKPCWYFQKPIWSTKNWRFENALRIHPAGELEIPLFPLACLLAAPPIARLVWRYFNPFREPWQCRCGYDLRGIPSGSCPECGRPISAPAPT